MPEFLKTLLRGLKRLIIVAAAVVVVVLGVGAPVWQFAIAAAVAAALAAVVIGPRSLYLIPLFVLPVLYFRRLWFEDLSGAMWMGAGAVAYGAVLFAIRGRSFMS